MVEKRGNVSAVGKLKPTIERARRSGIPNIRFAVMGSRTLLPVAAKFDDNSNAVQATKMNDQKKKKIKRNNNTTSINTRYYIGLNVDVQPAVIFVHIIFNKKKRQKNTHTSSSQHTTTSGTDACCVLNFAQHAPTIHRNQGRYPLSQSQHTHLTHLHTYTHTHIPHKSPNTSSNHT